MRALALSATMEAVENCLCHHSFNQSRQVLGPLDRTAMLVRPNHMTI